MSISLASIVQSEDCRLKDFLKKDWTAEDMKEENISLEDLGVLGKSPLYELMNKLKGFAKYYECKDEYEHAQRYERIKQYRDKISKKGHYNGSQHNRVLSQLRYEEGRYFKRKNKSVASTLEFEELYSAINRADRAITSVLECQANSNCSEWNYDTWFRAKNRQNHAIEDFEKTTGEKNPFIDIEDKDLITMLQEPHKAKHEALKQYMSRTSQNRPYSADQQQETYRQLRNEEENLLRTESKSNLDTREFKELKDATWYVDYHTVNVFACDIEGSIIDLFCACERQQLKKSLARKEFAVKDFEETSGEKNPFTD